MLIARLRNLEEYKEFREKNRDYFDEAWRQEQAMTPAEKKEFTVRGISYPGEDMVDFLVDFNYSDGANINWRERLVCPKTGLSNRLRACIHFADFELGIRNYHNVYITEQLTPLYEQLKRKFPLLIGSEYLGPEYTSGHVNENNIRHEDMTQLSIESEALDFYLSFECLEHIPDFYKAFSEMHRTLKPGGMAMWTVPFASNSHENIIRAFVSSEGEVCHLMEPEYHGDPVKSGGILCFTHFGWEMLDQMKNIGFSDAYALVYYSKLFGYMGGEQIVFVARK